MVQAIRQVAEAECSRLWTKFSRLCGSALMMRAIIHLAMPAGNIRQIVQKAEQLDAASSGNMTTVRMAVHAVKSARIDNVFCVPDTPRGSVFVPG
jgi:hypothetical protein